MKLTTSILVLIMVGGAWAQTPNIIQGTQDKLNAVQQQKTADSNAALAVAEGQPSQPAKPAPSVPASSATPAKPAASKPATSKPATSKPAAAQAAASKSAVVSAPAGKPAAAAAANTVAAPAASSTSGKTVSVSGAPASKLEVKQPEAKKQDAKKPQAKSVAVIVPKAAKSDKKAKSVVQAPSPAKPEEKEKKYAMTGKRDPFISPVVSHMGGSGCSTGKKCLEIGQINLKGVVRSDSGMIAVVTNSMNKAYFLRENDPVFNGYVEKITGDSITFKETFQDKLGKSFTRDVVKKILTPAV